MKTTTNYYYCCCIAAAVMKEAHATKITTKVGKISYIVIVVAWGLMLVGYCCCLW